ncbi:glycosyltransferase family A protein [Granulicella sp. dw_53]|uniref:glycosyltransferase family 2 protein n=1 Tax=Granulicella sp. dw_53 TaxID=2719792 RepID=UPI001BD37197|nr:glycosyltransferase family A protein [Granulicella sp. dw_53]
MNRPKVSFVVPCYKLAHLLSECVHSILIQTYTDFEVLIMDDDSPDDTAVVAASIEDPRVRYIHNEKNLGNLRNYNKGIELCRGSYIWLISADDYLRKDHILEWYMEVLERDSHVGYAFCPAIEVMDGRETHVLPYSFYGEKDVIVDGWCLLKKLLVSNFIVAGSVLARAECYRTIDYFPLDEGMEWSGDWYLWCVFALRYDVAYFAEPMVCYRAHSLSMTTTLAQDENLYKCSAGDLAVPLKVRQRALEAGLQEVADWCLKAIAKEYSQQVKSKRYQGSTWSLSLEQLEQSLCANIPLESERELIRARAFDAMGDNLWLSGDSLQAKRCYLDSVARDPWSILTYAKLFFVWLRIPGSQLRELRRYLRTAIAAR